MCDHLSLKWPDLVILDRDGVINHDSKAYIKSADEWMPIEGSLEAISKLSNAGVKIGIATNQRGISLGLYDHAALTEMHEKMYSLLTDLAGEIHALEFCTADDKTHPDRKPNPGMLLKIKDQLNMPADSVIYFVGDKQSDIKAAINAGVLPILVRTGNGEKTERDLSDGKKAQPLATFDSLSDFIHALSASTNAIDSI
ncbi:HAD-IIIA family hydrolase [Ignatzschineria sp. LJL83]